MDYRKLEDLIGHTLIKIDVDHDEIKFHRDDGKIVRMRHNQECCETVTVEDIDGDINDLVGLPLIEAEEAWRDAEPAEIGDDSGTWTFYKLGTEKGCVSIRWLGESNGYYSESVDIDVVDAVM